jgi:hypothetical protein
MYIPLKKVSQKPQAAMNAKSNKHNQQFYIRSVDVSVLSQVSVSESVFYRNRVAYF